MKLKQRLIDRIKKSRDFTETLLNDFQTPEQWTYQVHPQSNHALWFVGHMGNTDNFAISLLAPQRVRDEKAYRTLFGMGSQPVNDAKAYPPAADVLEFMRERRRTLLEIAAGLNEEDLEKSTPDGTPEFLSDYASVLEMIAWHEGLHAGQLTVVRRALGKKPLMGARAE